MCADRVSRAVRCQAKLVGQETVEQAAPMFAEPPTPVPGVERPILADRNCGTAASAGG